MRIKILKDDGILCKNAIWAKTVFTRMRGLLWRQSFGDLDGILLTPCSQIHSIGMRFNFDAIYLDKNYRIVALYENIGKNKILPYNVAVRNVLELPSGTISAKILGIGDVLKISKE